MDEVTLKMIASQLRKPEGAAGIETGLQMNHSNRHMNLFAIEALAPAAGDAILEIGMGNGEFVENIVSVDPSIRYTGSDYSKTMIDAATARNERFIQNGQVQFTLSTADALPFKEHAFNKIFGVNTIYFWDPDKELAELHRVLRPDGTLLLGIRPKAIMEHFPFTNYGFTLYTPEALRVVLERNNFVVTAMDVKKEPAHEFDGEMRSFETVIASASPRE